MKKNKNIILIPMVIVLTMLVIVLGGHIVYTRFTIDKGSKYVLNILKSDISYCDSYKDNTCHDVIYSIKTETKDAKVLETSDIFVLYNDNGLKIFDNKTKRVKKIDLEYDYDFYSFHLNEEKTKVIGIIAWSSTFNSATSEFKNVYYNLNLNKKMYQNKYYGLAKYNDDFIIGYDSKHPINNHMLYTSKEESIDGKNLYALETKNGLYIIDSYLYNIDAIYTENKKLIVSNIETKSLTFHDDYLYILKNDNTIHKYDVNGNLIEIISNYSNPLGFIDNFIVYIDNSLLKIKNIVKQEEIIIVDWNNKYELTNYSQYLEKENKLCIAIREKDKLNDYGNDLIGIEYYYDFSTKEVTRKNINGGFTYQAMPLRD